MDLTFRAIKPEDEEFLMTVFASGIAEKLAESQWPVSEWASMITQQFNAQHKTYHSRFPLANFDIVLVDGEQAGRLYADRRKDEIRILDLTLLPNFREQGIGTALIKQLFSEASKSGQTVSAHVEHHNRALRLAERLGFLPKMETPSTTLMVWQPKALAS